MTVNTSFSRLFLRPFSTAFALTTMILLTSFIQAASVSAHPMITDIQGNWQINGNGSPGTLVIQATQAPASNAPVNFNGTAYGNPINGTYDLSTGKIFFVRYLGPSYVQSFSGNITNAGNSIAGDFQEFRGPDQTTIGPSYQWNATRQQSYSSVPCVHVSKSTIALSTNHQQDTFVLTNCGPTGSWGAPVYTEGVNGQPAPINFYISPPDQSKDGSFPSGARVTITVYVKSIVVPVPHGHYTGGIPFDVYGNGKTINGAAIVAVSFDA